MVFSTSITKGINPERFNKANGSGTVRFQRFHGGKSRHMSNYVPTHLFEERPDTVIIHVGGNDLPTSRENPIPPVKIANQIIETALICKKFEVQNILISGVTTRRAHFLQQRCNELNNILKGLCKSHNLIYIDNSAIKVEHLYDGVHLNDDGTKILADNYLNHLKLHSS